MQRAKPEDWWKTEKKSNDVTLITEPYLQEFYRCNCWHVRGRDKDMLIDSGMGVVSLREWVPIVTEKSLPAVASHTHFDHIGCHHEFEDVAVHSAEVDIISEPTRLSTLANPYVTDDIFTKLPPVPYQSSTYEVKSVKPTRILDDGDIIDLGDRHFEVIHTPGHSPGGIALWESKTSILFSGDIVYNGPLIEDTYHSNAPDYYKSMIRLFDLPAKVVHGGHFVSYDGVTHRRIIRAWLDEKEKE